MSANWFPWFASAIACFLVDTGILMLLVVDVNRTLAPDKKFWPIGWYPGKLGRVLEIHKREYPSSSLRKIALIFLVVGLGLFLRAGYAMNQ